MLEEGASMDILKQTIEANKDILADLKRCNKMMKDIARTRVNGDSHVSVIQTELKAKQDEAQMLRTDYDKLVADDRCQSEKLAQQVELLRDLQQEGARLLGEPAALRQVRLAENRLDKASTKHQEAARLKNAYIQLLDKLQSDCSSARNRLHDIQQNLSSASEQASSLQQQVRLATEGRVAAVSQLAHVQQRLKRHRELSRDAASQEQPLSAGHELPLNYQKAAVHEAAETEYGSGPAATSARIQCNSEEALGMEALSLHQLWHAVSQETRINTIQELAALPVSQSEAQQSLQRLHQDGLQSLCSLQEAKSRLQEALDGESRQDVQKYAEVLQDGLHNLHHECDRLRTDADQLSKSMAATLSGISHLHAMVCDSAEPPRLEELTEDDCIEAVTVVCAKASQLLKRTA